jgi:hypothetical protein
MRLSMATYHFETEDADLYGVECAIVLYNIRFWILKNIANKKHFHDELYWTYNSAKAFEELFPFWNWQKIGRLLRKLEDAGAIRSGNYNKAGFDKTKWYSIPNTRCLYLNNGAFNSERPIPDNKPDSKQHILSAVAEGGLEKPTSPSQAQNNSNPQPSQGAIATALQQQLETLSAPRRAAFELWLEWKKEKRQAYKPTGLKMLIKKWSSVSDASLLSAIEFSVAQGYSGIYEEKKQGFNGGGQVNTNY